jgi:PAS domain S-box-containing protein
MKHAAHVLGALGDAAALMELDTHRVAFANDALSSLSGYARDELRALPSLAALIQQDDVLSFQACMRRLSGDGAGHATFDTTLSHASGLRVSVEVVASRLEIDRRLVVAVIREVGGRPDHVEARRMAHVEAMRTCDDFLAMASHELRTPLTPLLLKVQALERGLARSKSEVPAERILHDLERIEAHVTRLVRLTGSLLDVSLIGGGHLSLERSATDLVELTRAVVSRFAQDGTRIMLDAPDRVVGLWDAVRLDQVVTNLVANAVKYGGQTAIDVRVEDHGAHARLLVRDEGVGIDPADHARIFDRFERVSEHPQVAGFGIGLWLVAQVVQAHGGEVGVQSARGHGATFFVTLPAGAAG